MKYNVFIVKSANKTLTYRVQCMLFNATFKNISDISWLSVLLVEETCRTPTYLDRGMAFNATFNNISVILCGQFYW